MKKLFRDDIIFKMEAQTKLLSKPNSTVDHENLVSIIENKDLNCRELGCLGFGSTIEIQMTHKMYNLSYPVNF